jgi:hypothetical protein
MAAKINGINAVAHAGMLRLRLLDLIFFDLHMGGIA